MSVNSNKLSMSLITPAYNNPEEVKKLLASVQPEVLKDRTLEAIVVDDCSSDDSIRKVAQESGFARYIRLDRNSGPAVARNVGAKSAKNEILVFVDSDVILNSDTLPRIRNKFSQDKSVAIFGGEYDLEPANPSFTTKFKSLMVCSWRPRENVVTDFLTRVGAIRKNIFDEMGGFDTNLRTAAVEDYEFARRLMNKGYIISYDPTLTVKHHFPEFKSQIRTFFHRSFMWIYIFKKYKKFDNTCTTPLIAIAQTCGFLSSLLLIIAVININFIYASLFFLILFVLTNLRFFKLTFKYEGLVFTLRSIPMALILSCSIFLGGILGVVYYFLYEGVLKKN